MARTGSNQNGPHAAAAQDCPVWKKEKETQRVRVQNRVSFPEAWQLVEANMPTVISGCKSYSAVVSNNKDVNPWNMSNYANWVFSDRPLRTVQSNLRESRRS